MLEEVCKYQNYFKAEGFTPFPISCNYSRKQMQDDESPIKYKRIIDQYQTDPTLIEIELTEEGAIQDMEKAIKHAKALKEEGFKLSIDDFGSGYSSIQLFYKLPIDVLKLDKSLIPNVKMGDVEKDIIKSIIKIARNHKISVIWEGVETEEHLAFITDLGCELAQGYFYARPLPFDEFVNFLKK